VPGERIMVVDDTPGVAKLVATHLEAAGLRPLVAESGQEALDLLSQNRPDLFIVDIMMPGMDGFELTRRLRADPRTASTPIVVLTARDTIDDKVRGFEAGADDYVVKPFEAAELLARVRALLARRRLVSPESVAEEAGIVIAVFGLRGGAGRSSLAANLAVALAMSQNRDIVACDLALESGHLALMLDARPAHTVDQLVTRYGSALESEVLVAHLVETSFRVRLLAAPLSPASAALVTATETRAIVEQLRRLYPFVVLDLSPTFSDVNLEVFETADLVLLVTTPEMAGVRSAASGLQVLDSLGFPEANTFLVVNHVSDARPLADPDIASATGRSIDLTVPHDGRAMVDAVNRGAPVVVSAPRSPAARAITSFAQQLAKRTESSRRSSNAVPAR